MTSQQQTSRLRHEIQRGFTPRGSPSSISSRASSSRVVRYHVCMGAVRDVVLLGCMAGWGCSADSSGPSPAPVSTPTASEPAKPDPAPEPVPTAIDEFFVKLRGSLPKPETLSQQNGLSIDCGERGTVTLTLLNATASKVPLEKPNDLVHLVPWLGDEDVCLRHIAVQAAVDFLNYDRDQLVVPHMHDPEHVLFRDIMLALRARLDEAGVEYAASLFDGVLLSLDEDDFARLAHGTWTQDVDHSTVNFFSEVEVGADEVRVTRKHTTEDPKWPDHTWATRVSRVSLHAEGHYVVVGKWDRESDATGYEGALVVPSKFQYAFIPVRGGVLWWKGGTAMRWTKLRRG